mgnify:CR=1 FL=1
MKDPGRLVTGGGNCRRNLLTEVVQQVVELLETRPSIRGVLVVGDLTSRSDLKGYEECVDYLFQALRLDDVKLWNNRGASRRTREPSTFSAATVITQASMGTVSSRSYARCGPIEGSILTVDQVRSTNLSASDGEAAIHSLNSMHGLRRPPIYPRRSPN